MSWQAAGDVELLPNKPTGLVWVTFFFQMELKRILLFVYLHLTSRLLRLDPREAERVISPPLAAIPFLVRASH